MPTPPTEDLPSRTGGWRGVTPGWLGRLGAPPLALTVYALMPGGPDGLSRPGRATVAVVVLMAVLWMTEAMPLPATALVPLVLFPLAGALPMDATAAAYANQVIFLFLGGFLIARGMERWGLHRRLALIVLEVAGSTPRRLVAGFMVATAFLSMWISNTATVVMIFPIAIGVLGLIGARAAADGSQLSTCLLLAIAFSASIGSVGTIIGTPPNVLLQAFVEERYDIAIGFGQWMLIGVPLVLVFLPLAWLVLVRVYPPGSGRLESVAELVRDEHRRLGRLSRGEGIVLGVFVATVLAWILRQPLTGWAWFRELAPWIENVTDPGIAMAGALLLFAIPVHPRRGEFALDWESARGLPWGILILVGGGLALAAAVQENGVDAWIGERLSGLGALPLVLLVAAVAGVVLSLTEVTSNTATAATLLPVLGGVALAIGVDPLTLLVPAALAASCSFMMPVATPPNAIVFASGELTVAQMARAGVWLNLIAVALVTAVAFTTAAWVLP